MQKSTINKSSKPEQMDSYESRDDIIFDNLIYCLCGLDTTFLKISIKDKNYVLSVESDYPSELIKPFESICINVRIVNKFILKSQYSSDSIRRFIGDVLEEYLVGFMKKVSDLRETVSTIEALLINIEEDVAHFEILRSVIDATKGIDGAEIVNIIEAMRNRNIRYEDVYKRLLESCILNIEKEIAGWICKGELYSINFMIRKNTDSDGFDKCFWSSRYIIDEKNIPFFSRDTYDQIYTCGKLINLNRELGYVVNVNEETVYTNGIYYIYNYLNEVSYSNFRDSVNRDLAIVKKYFFCYDLVFYDVIYLGLDSNIFGSAQKQLRKINLLNKVEKVTFACSDSSFINSISRILDPSTNMLYNLDLTVFECINIKCEFEILGYFLTKNTFHGLELIFRFLFALNTLEYFFVKEPKFRFSKMALLFIRNFKFAFYSGIKEFRFQKDINKFVNEFDVATKKALHALYITNADTFVILSQYFELCVQYITIYNKETIPPSKEREFEDGLVEIFKRMSDVFKRYNDDFILICALENFENENIFIKC